MLTSFILCVSDCSASRADCFSIFPCSWLELLKRARRSEKCCKPAAYCETAQLHWSDYLCVGLHLWSIFWILLYLTFDHGLTEGWMTATSSLLCFCHDCAQTASPNFLLCFGVSSKKTNLHARHSVTFRVMNDLPAAIDHCKQGEMNYRATMKTMILNHYEFSL